MTMTMKKSESIRSNDAPTLTPALLHDVAYLLRRFVPRDEEERTTVMTFLKALGKH